MRFFIFLLSLLCLSSAFAGETESPLLTRLYFYNPEMRYERDADQNYVNRNPQGFALGFKKEDWALVLETSYFSESSGNSTLSISRQHQEGTLWLRRHFCDRSFEAMSGSLFISAGIGGYQDKVTTTLNGDSENDSGTLSLMGGVSFGIELLAVAEKDYGVVFSFETRALTGSDFDPNPMFSGLFQFGLQF